ncbi:ribosome silencing factor [bacterium]|nr:ribosome silencing factor [bacterium]
MVGGSLRGAGSEILSKAAPAVKMHAGLAPNLDKMLSIVVKAVDAKKGENIIVLDLSEQVDYLDYLVICSGQTELHNRAIADHISKELASCDIICSGLQGYRYGDWIVLDYSSLVVHIFSPSLREFYRLEELWAAGKEVSIT